MERKRLFPVLATLGLLALAGASCSTSGSAAQSAERAPAPQAATEQPEAATPSPAQPAPAGVAAASNAPKKPLSEEQALKEELKRAPFDEGDWKTNFRKRSVRLNDFLGGGPPKDGIPALTNPSFVTVKEADKWLEDPEAVEVVEIKGDARAYPQQVMVWHEIVNDVVGGEPVAVTF